MQGNSQTFRVQNNFRIPIVKPDCKNPPYLLNASLTKIIDRVNELLLSHVEEHHIHVIAKEGTPMEDLPEASLLQSSDFIPAIERGLTAGAVTGVICGLVAMALPPAGLVIGGEPMSAPPRDLNADSSCDIANRNRTNPANNPQ